MAGSSNDCPPLTSSLLGQCGWAALRKDLRELMERQLADQESGQVPTLTENSRKRKFSEPPGENSASLEMTYRRSGTRNGLLSTRVWDGLQHDFCSERRSSWCPEWYLSLRKWLKNLDEPVRTGSLAGLVASTHFECVILVLIISNCVFTIYAANYVMDHPEGMNSWMLAADICFCVAFLFELVLRIVVHRLFFFCSGDWKWNCWDFLTVTSATGSILATNLAGRGIALQYFRALRILKVAKILRLVRVLRFSRELRLMLDCLMGCVMSIFWSMIMLLFILCLASMFSVQRLGSFLGDLANDNPSASDPDALEVLVSAFRSVHIGMLSLFMAASGGEDWGPYLTSMWVTGWVDGCAFLGFITLFNLAILNIVTSVFLDKVMMLAQPSTDELIQQKKKREMEEAKEIMRHFSRMDEGTGRITRETFVDHMCGDPEIKALLDLWGLAIGDPGHFFDVVTLPDDINADGVRVATLAKTCLGLRGPATAVDLSMLGYRMWKMQVGQQRFERYCTEQLEAMDRILAAGGTADPHAASSDEENPVFRSVLVDILSLQSGVQSTI